MGTSSTLGPRNGGATRAFRARSSSPTFLAYLEALVPSKLCAQGRQRWIRRAVLTRPTWSQQPASRANVPHTGSVSSFHSGSPSYRVSSLLGAPPTKRPTRAPRGSLSKSVGVIPSCTGIRMGQATATSSSSNHDRDKSREARPPPTMSGTTTKSAPAPYFANNPRKASGSKGCPLQKHPHAPLSRK